ncbi:tetratricopeptide repeat protein [Pseudopedobacter saltans]|uniref:tetratricopeptide repeat protein n=1 Tax=Pseudopedobacter saltans TaxID=151895 RepID=UPI000694EFAB|nr:tetratricopeptide repeat protein [Pseudopedobacter saltans]
MKKILLSILSILYISLNVFSQDNENIVYAQQLFGNGEYEKAKKIYERLYQNKNFKEIAYDGYMNTLFKLKEYDLAEKVIKKEIKDDSGNQNLKVYLIQLYIEKGDKPNADKTLNDLLGKLPPNNFSISQIANNFYRINQYEYAAKVFIQGRKVINSNNAFSFELINLYKYLQQKDFLTQELINLVETQPEYLPSVKSNFSRAYQSNEDYQILKSLLIKRLQKNTDNLALSELLAWTYIQIKEFNLALIQTISIDKRTDGNGALLFQLAAILKDEYQYAYAQKAYEQLILKGKNNPYYISAQIELLKIKQEQANNKGSIGLEAAALETAYEAVLTEFGYNQRTLFAVLELAKVKANYLNKLPAAEKLLLDALNIPRLNPNELAEVKLELADVNILNNNPWEASLLYGQIEKSLPNTVLGQEAKFRNAKIAFYNADFKWAKAQLDVLKASTSQLIANDALDLSLLIQEHFDEDSSNNALKTYAKAEFLREQHLHEQALSKLDSVLKAYPNTDLADDILLSKAKIYEAKRDYKQAISYYEKLCNDFSNSIWIDDAIYNIGIIYQDKIQNNQSASLYYEKLIKDHPGSIYTIDARKRFRLLRGDSL